MVDKMSDNIKIMSAKLDEASLQVQKTEPEGFSQNIVSNINNVRPTVNAGEEAQEMVDPVLAPYHRSMESKCNCIRSKI